MTKRALVISALTAIAVVVLGGWFALHHVPSPFAGVTLRGDTVVAQIRPGTSFGFVRQSTRVGEHISDSASIELRDGESVMLGSPHTGYTITCRVSPRPAGLYIQGSWFLHDFLRSSLKTWFVEAH
jgi:hypothetical protein